MIVCLVCGYAYAWAGLTTSDALAGATYRCVFTNLHTEERAWDRFVGDGISFDSNDGALFTGNGYLEVAHRRFGSRLPVSGTLALEIKPEQAGGIFWTPTLSMAITDGGTLVLMASVGDKRGSMYREIPIGKMAMGQWHQVVVSYGDRQLDVVVNGVRLLTKQLQGVIQPQVPGAVLIGAWKAADPPVGNFPKAVQDFLFERRFRGYIRYVAYWDYPFSERAVADLCHVQRIDGAQEDAASTMYRHYDAFFERSRAGDVKQVREIGKTMRHYMAQDPRRPSFHLTAPMDAILDPAGAVYHGGKYHLYSYRNMISLLAYTPLAHFVSDDLLHWDDYPIALWPDDSLDTYGIWLGNIWLADQQRPRMFYTALGQTGKYGVMAESDDDLITFGNKKLVMSDMEHHDGHVWKDEDTYYALTTRQHWGRSADSLGDDIVLLASTDLLRWETRGTIFNARKHREPKDNQQQWGFAEYPYLLPFGDKYVLMLGTRPARYWVGTFDSDKPAFIPDNAEGMLLDYLNPFHCFNPLTVDAAGPQGSQRRIIHALQLYASGEVGGIRWSGTHVTPRVLELVDGRLTQTPVPELDKLRKLHSSSVNFRLDAAVQKKFVTLEDGRADVVIEVPNGQRGIFGFHIASGTNSADTAVVFFDLTSNRFGVKGGIKVPVDYPELGDAPAFLPQDSRSASMRVIIDGSLIEVFVNGQSCTGVLNGDCSTIAIRPFCSTGTIDVGSLTIWNIQPKM
ncbi:Sucrose-6-phosphate hydrolase SacC, GH32 family [Parapedobacter koreensis]|uniref:beta-fructofuranosidase n=1 Tax=Parapedobacter koreensis TaxID=332977 RepID=A0A1H7EVI6_9SPHI|nr:Sucrose-6-phosphate hydrolase SacC, GH32 family [Parapedobacter koreensis]